MARSVVNYDGKSSTLLDAIRGSAPQYYQDAVPLTTQENLATVGSAILDWEATRSYFLNALFDRIGLVVIKNKLYQNPLGEFKKGVLRYGKDIEEIFVDIIEAKEFDPEVSASEEFKRELPDVKAVFHTVNRQNKYKTTIQETDLEMAFTGEEGMMNLINKILEMPYTSNNLHEFWHMKNLINVYGNEGKFNIQVISPVSDEATAKAAMTKIKEISNTMTFMRKDFNYAGVYTHTVKEDQIVLIDTAFDALVDVEVLASAFNMSKADFIGRRVLIDDFGGLENIRCAVVDRDWFMVYDRFVKAKQKEVADGLYYNFWLHVHQVLSVSPFANAVLFAEVAPTLTALDVTPATATVSKGGSQPFRVEATGTNYPPTQVEWTHNGTSDKTFVSTTGLLYVGSDETTTPITVTATSTFDAGVSDTATITVV